MAQSPRELFDIPDNIAYFNCAYNAPQLKESRNRLLSAVSEKNHPWKRTPSSFFNDAETIRKLASDIFGGDSEGYAIIPAASYGISSAARAIEPFLSKGDHILLMAEEFPSNVLPWKRVAKERDAEIVTIPAPHQGSWAEAIIDKIDNRTKVVALSHCHWTNGAYVDLHSIRKACNETQTSLVVDATQSLGAMPFQVDEIRPDFLVAAGYKWLLCPYGFSIMYVSRQWRDARPLEETWLARENAENFASLVQYSDRYMQGARRFDVGEKCTSLLPGAIAALQQIKNWSVPYIADSLSVINKKIAAGLLELGFQLPNDRERSPHMFGAWLPAHVTVDLVSELRQKNIFISQRGKSVRFAPHLHITDHDLERLLDAVHHLIK